MTAVYLITYFCGYHVWKFSFPFLHYHISAGNVFEIIMHGKSWEDIHFCSFRLM